MLSRISTPVTTLGGFMRVAIGNSSSLQRLDEVLYDVGKRDEIINKRMNSTDVTAASSDDEDSDRQLTLPTFKSELVFDKVCFKYSKEDDSPYVIDSLSMSISRGVYACIVGPSGCGKSTLLSMLMQFNSPWSGKVLLDGKDIFTHKKTSYMRQIAVVFQQITVLNGTILDNIRYGNVKATDEECYNAAKLAQCTFISGLQNGFETIVGQHATCSLSGGQAQRICLARALCRKPKILLLDEATSALDPETEMSIISTIIELVKKLNMTVISVTHRLQTTIHADVIFVLDKGKVIEKGTYNTLIAVNGSVFSEMVNSGESEVTPTSDDEIKESPVDGGPKNKRNGRPLAKKGSRLQSPLGRKSNFYFTNMENDNITREHEDREKSVILQNFAKNLTERVDHEETRRSVLHQRGPWDSVLDTEPKYYEYERTPHEARRPKTRDESKRHHGKKKEERRRKEKKATDENYIVL